MASVYRKPGRAQWYMRVKDGTGRWRDLPTHTDRKTEARRLAEDYQRKAERQHLGLEPLPVQCEMTLAALCDWWLRERCPAASIERERCRLRRHVIDTPLGKTPIPQVTTYRIEEHLRLLEDWSDWSTVPAEILPAQVEQAPARQEKGRSMPCSSATSKMYSSSGTSIVVSRPSASLINLTLKVAI